MDHHRLILLDVHKCAHTLLHWAQIRSIGRQNLGQLVLLNCDILSMNFY